MDNHNWKVLVAGGAVAGLSVGAIGVTSLVNGSNRAPEGIELSAAERALADGTGGLDAAPASVSPIGQLDATTTRPDTWLQQDAVSLHSQDSPPSADSLTSPGDSPHSADSVDTPDSADTPDSPPSADSLSSPGESPLSPDSVDTPDSPASAEEAAAGEQAPAEAAPAPAPAPEPVSAPAPAPPPPPAPAPDSPDSPDSPASAASAASAGSYDS